VDNPRDIKAAMTARAVGLELLRENRQSRDMKYILKTGVEGSRALIESERALGPEERGKLRPLTRWNLQKVLKYKDEVGINSFRKKAEEYAV
jgi:large subunit ribosomal protein L17